MNLLLTAAADVQSAAHMAHQTSPALQSLGLAIVLGVMLVLISRRIGVSAIVLLLIGGVVVGPQMLGWVHPSSLGRTLGTLINLSVALILFEGGMTLNIDGYKSASTMIKRLLSVGVLVTWIGTAAIIWFLFGETFGDRPIAMAMLAASLVIVTGPTVIAPLLRRIRVREDLHDILHWEGVLIDPIGVFIAVLMYEYFTGEGAGVALEGFATRVVAGLVVGAIMGFASDFILRRRWVPDDSLNIFAVAVAILTFVIDDMIVPESGLLGVTVAGLILGWRRPGPLRGIKEFKAEITYLLVGALFILLAAQLDFADFKRFGWTGLWLVLGVVFVIRPLSIFCCSYGTDLGWRERLFLSYVAPRGIVAASMASLFALSLAGNDSAWFLVAFTFSVIGFTVILQGSTAGLLARLLGLQLPEPDGWLIVGAHAFGRRVAEFISRHHGVEVVLVDSNRRAIEESRRQGFHALTADALAPDIHETDDMRRVGNVLALTDNEELNQLICQHWIPVVGRDSVHRWSSTAPGEAESTRQPVGVVIWSNLPKPSLISAEMLRHEIMLLETTDGATVEGIPLMTADNGALSLGGDGKEPKGTGLWLRRSVGYLPRALRRDLVLQITEPITQQQLFVRMLDMAARAEPTIDNQRILAELLERESSFPSALGHGIAVPHAYARTLSRRVCVVARLTHGIDFRAPDAESVCLIFLVISPVGDPEGHLATMGEIARLVSTQATRENLLAAEDLAAVLPIPATVVTP